MQYKHTPQVLASEPQDMARQVLKYYPCTKNNLAHSKLCVSTAVNNQVLRLSTSYIIIHAVSSVPDTNEEEKVEEEEVEEEAADEEVENIEKWWRI